MIADSLTVRRLMVNKLNQGYKNKSWLKILKDKIDLTNKFNGAELNKFVDNNKEIFGERSIEYQDHFEISITTSVGYEEVYPKISSGEFKNIINRDRDGFSEDKLVRILGYLNTLSQKQKENSIEEILKSSINNEYKYGIISHLNDYLKQDSLPFARVVFRECPVFNAQTSWFWEKVITNTSNKEEIISKLLNVNAFSSLGNCFDNLDEISITRYVNSSLGRFLEIINDNHFIEKFKSKIISQLGELNDLSKDYVLGRYFSDEREVSTPSFFAGLSTSFQFGSSKKEQKYFQVVSEMLTGEGIRYDSSDNVLPYNMAMVLAVTSNYDNNLVLDYKNELQKKVFFYLLEIFINYGIENAKGWIKHFLDNDNYFVITILKNIIYTSIASL